jgi:hypothetical protein
MLHTFRKETNLDAVALGGVADGDILQNGIPDSPAVSHRQACPKTVRRMAQ